jgi:hypothetical protein
MMDDTGCSVGGMLVFDPERICSSIWIVKPEFGK